MGRLQVVLERGSLDPQYMDIVRIGVVLGGVERFPRGVGLGGVLFQECCV